MGFQPGKGPRKAVVTREDWTLLVIAASDGLLPIQLQRSLFLLLQRVPELAATGFYEFRPVVGGDYSEQIYSDADAFARKGFVSIQFSEEDGSRRYRVTRSGEERAKNLEKLVPPDLGQFLHKTVSWVRTRSIDQLLRGSTESTGSTKPGSGRRSVWSR